MDIVFEKTRMPDGTMIEEVSFYDAVPTVVVNALTHAMNVNVDNERLKGMRDAIKKDMS